MRTLAALLLVLLLALGALAWALDAGAIPDRLNPFAPLVVADPPNFLTRFKLSRLASDPALCQSVLEGAELSFEAVPDRTTEPGCTIANAVRIESTTVRVGTPFVLTCPTAVALALWETHVLQPEARTRFGQPVARMQHFGSYACRNIYGRADARRSQHATADALDLAGFTLADGREVRVLVDWAGGDADAAFLRDVHRGACRFFDGVLGPDYNAAHRDHLHLDRGSWRVCR